MGNTAWFGLFLAKSDLMSVARASLPCSSIAEVTKAETRNSPQLLALAWLLAALASEELAGDRLAEFIFKASGGRQSGLRPPLAKDRNYAPSFVRQ
jgi:hypothetical protein